MLGHIEQWFYSGLGGIRVDMARKPGHQLEIRPAIVGNLKWVRVSYDSVLGKIVSNWQRHGTHLNLKFVVPAHTTARVYLPTTDPQKLKINHRLLRRAGVHVIRILRDEVIFDAPPGHYWCTGQYY